MSMTVFKIRPLFMFQIGHFSKSSKHAQNHANSTQSMMENHYQDELMQNISRKDDFSKNFEKCMRKCSEMAENKENII